MSRNPSPYRIEKPCPKSWDEMSGDAKRRFCEHCQLHVHNLSAMSDREREGLMQNRQARVCISYEVGRDGSMITPTKWAWLRKPLRPLAAMLAVMAPALSAACTKVTRTTGVPAPGRSHSSASRLTGEAPAAPPHDSKSFVLGKMAPAQAPPPPKQQD